MWAEIVLAGCELCLVPEIVPQQIGLFFVRPEPLPLAGWCTGNEELWIHALSCIDLMMPQLQQILATIHSIPVLCVSICFHFSFTVLSAQRNTTRRCVSSHKHVAYRRSDSVSSQAVKQLLTWNSFHSTAIVMFSDTGTDLIYACTIMYLCACVFVITSR